MKHCRQLCALVLTSFCYLNTAWATDYFVQQAGADSRGYSSQYNPWRPQPPRWGYQRHQGNVNYFAGDSSANSARQLRRYAAPISQIQARQFEYQRYVEQVRPYYGMNNGLPWWADQSQVPYGPWAIGSGWPNGLW